MTYKKEYLYKKIVKAKLFLDAHYTEALNLDAIICEANVSKFHFIRLFKAMYKLTPHQYLIEIRVKKAKLELENTNESISSICHKIGFISIGSFCNLFKNRTSKTPLEYRNTFKKLKENRRQTPLENIPGCYGLIHHK